ncbi:hypothetical protein [Diaphorobacter sp.]|uniref:hypothetical protein n=1 Tax=Diaphorobacter sp. TaxID=1934310 RepID=UPI002584586B|nr:hypothetical protein [Diaphorobacter sp.]
MQMKLALQKVPSALRSIACKGRTAISKTWWTFPIAFMGLVFWLFYQGYFPIQGGNLEQRGQFGDSFGVLNSLFTGLGFGGIIVTLILQQKQISQQENEIRIQRQSEEARHYEETLHKLLSLYATTLNEVSSPKGELRGRSVLRGSTDRVFEAIKKEKAQLVPQQVQERYKNGKLTKDDESFLDYLYFRNFKILTVEIDRQGRLTQTMKVLLHHLIRGIPSHMSIEPYQALVCAQITYVELSYFFLVALAFKKESDLREFLLKSGLLKKAANIKRLRIHDYMYEQFWGVRIGEYKEPHLLPISDARINQAIRAYRRQAGQKAPPAQKSYTSPRTQQPGNHQ